MFGVLAINKPQGMTSRHALNKLQRVIDPIRVGHTGTLDPIATGVLLVACGSATRLTEFSHLSSKAYRGAFQLGYRSDTLDADGVVERLATASPITAERLQAELPNWLGTISQTPPKYSAVHVDGKRAHELARKGKDFELPSRKVTIYSLRLVSLDGDVCVLDIECSTGTYIRTLASDVAQRLGSDAVMIALQRTRIGAVDIAQCWDLDDCDCRDTIMRRLLPPSVLVEALPSVRLDDVQVHRIRNGIPLELSNEEAGPLAAFAEDAELIAILQRDGQLFRSLRVFQPAKKISDPTSQPMATRAKQSPES